jgi:hypothetical protein
LEVRYQKSALKTLPVTFIIRQLQPSIKPGHKGTDRKMIQEVKEGEEKTLKWGILIAIISPDRT